MTEPIVERIRAIVRLLGDEHITPTGRRQVEQVLEDIEERSEGHAEPPTPGYPTMDEWRARYNALGATVHRRIYDEALLACPKCAMRGVPISYAVVAAETVLATSQQQKP